MKVLVPGGGGYVGAVLVPWLLADGHEVTVYDTFWFGNAYLPDNGSLTVIKADLRCIRDMASACDGQDAVICLAGITSDAMCQKYDILARTVNIGGMDLISLRAKMAGVKTFIFASSVAAYGSSDGDAKEADELVPTTSYAKCKAAAERLVLENFPEAVIVRSASVCGYSPRQRFDLTVNMMVRDAMQKGVITVNGGEQKRSHIHIQDVCNFYRILLGSKGERITGQVFNLVADNATVAETANLVSAETGARVETKPRSDNRSYTVDGSKALMVLGYKARRNVRQAVLDLKARFDSGMWKDSMTNQAYMNMADIADEFA